MQRLTSLLFGLLCHFLIVLPLSAQQNLVFNGQSLHDYIGQTVTFPQTFVVCGHYQNQYGGYLYLSYERLRSADEWAAWATPLYDSIVAAHATAILTARCPSHLRADTLRLGSTIAGISATVLDSFYLQIDSYATLTPHTRPTIRPDVGAARLIICTNNLEYYCPLPDSNGYGAWNNEEFARQNHKILKGLANIEADIYALEELQQGQTSLTYLVDGLRARTHLPYAAVADYDTQTSSDSYLKVGFLYRTDKVRPIKHLGHPYAPSSSAFYNQIGNYYREEIQCFEEIATSERFVLCANHFKSKSGGTDSNQYYNATRVENAQYLLDFLTTELQNNYYQDPDILIVGDLNCSAAEEPIQLLEQAGYENQLTRFAPNGYSYSYRNEVQYLDHVLASASLAPQITGVQPYHLNADEIYTRYYKYSTDTTMYRYSDHDPIIIGLSLQATPPDSCQPVDITETFAHTFGCFAPVNAVGSAIWWGYTNYHCAYMSGYNVGANTDWLVGPTVDLRDKEPAIIAFTHTLAYGNRNTWAEHCKLLISNDYDGDVTSATWQQLPIPNFPAYNYAWTTNHVAVPTQFMGQEKVTVAFLYETAADSDQPTWEIKDFSLRAACSPNTDPTHIAQPRTPKPHIAYCSGGHIYVQLTDTELVRIYNSCGKCIYQGKSAHHCSHQLSAGLYLIAYSDGSVQKIIVP